jgi:hypothetical protein
MADASLFDAVKDFIWAPALALVGWAWKRNEKEHDDMRANISTLGSHLNDRLMDHIDDQVKEVRLFVVAEDAKLMGEMGVQRGHIGKIFDKLEESSKRSEDRHLQLLEKISDLSTAMHTALSHKVDK